MHFKESLSLVSGLSWIMAQMSICSLKSSGNGGYISTGMGDHLSDLLMSLMALQLALVERNPFSALFTKN